MKRKRAHAPCASDPGVVSDEIASHDEQVVEVDPLPRRDPRRAANRRLFGAVAPARGQVRLRSPRVSRQRAASSSRSECSHGVTSLHEPFDAEVRPVGRDLGSHPASLGPLRKLPITRSSSTAPARQTRASSLSSRSCRTLEGPQSVVDHRLDSEHRASSFDHSLDVERAATKARLPAMRSKKSRALPRARRRRRAVARPRTSNSPSAWISTWAPRRRRDRRGSWRTAPRRPRVAGDLIRHLEVQRQSSLDGVLGEESLCKAVDRRDRGIVDLTRLRPRSFIVALAKRPVELLTKLGRGCLGEGDRRDVGKLDATGGEQSHDSPDERGRLPGAGTRLDEERRAEVGCNAVAVFFVGERYSEPRIIGQSSVGHAVSIPNRPQGHREGQSTHQRDQNVAPTPRSAREPSGRPCRSHRTGSFHGRRTPALPAASGRAR
jgi:hypothetical protein